MERMGQGEGRLSGLVVVVVDFDDGDGIEEFDGWKV